MRKFLHLRPLLGELLRTATSGLREMDKAWKRHERAVAEKLGTKRIPTTGHPFPDMVVEFGEMAFAVEHKSRKANPGWLLDALDQSVVNSFGRIPIVLHTFYGERKNREVVSMDLDTFMRIVKSDGA